MVATTETVAKGREVAIVEAAAMGAYATPAAAATMAAQETAEVGVAHEAAAMAGGTAARSEVETEDLQGVGRVGSKVAGAAAAEEMVRAAGADVVFAELWQRTGCKILVRKR